MNILKCKSIGEWYEAARRERYSFPLAVCNALSETMRELKLSFQEAYNLLMDKEKLILVEEYKFYILDLSYRKLWEAKAGKPSRPH